jgi:hypothetical protein
MMPTTLTDAVVYISVFIVMEAWSKACRTGFVGGAGGPWREGGRRDEASAEEEGRFLRLQYSIIHTHTGLHIQRQRFAYPLTSRLD